MAALKATPSSRLRSLAAPGAALCRSWWRFVVSDALRLVTVTSAAWAATPWRPLLRFWLAVLAVAVTGGAVLESLGPLPPERSRGEQARSEPLRSAEPRGSKPATTPARHEAAAPMQLGSAETTASSSSALGSSTPAPSRAVASVSVANPPAALSAASYPRLIAAMDMVADSPPAPSVAVPQPDEKAVTPLGLGERGSARLQTGEQMAAGVTPGGQATARSGSGKQSAGASAPGQVASDADPQGTGHNNLALVSLHPTATSGDGKALAERLASQAGLAPDQIGTGPPGGSRSAAAVIRFYVAADHALARRLGYGLGHLGYPWRIENRSGRPSPPGSQEPIEVWLPEP